MLAANGRRDAFQAIRGGRTAIVVRDLPSGRERVAARGARVGGGSFADVYEPGLSADGTRLVFTLASGRVGDVRTARSEVRVRDLRRRSTTVVSPGTPGTFSADGAISPDGRWVAFTTEEAGRMRLRLHDLATRKTITVPTGGDRVLDPVVSRGGRAIAYTSLHGDAAQVRAWTRASGATTLVSRATGRAGAAADGDAADPSISDDGRLVAFASAATNLPAAGRDDTRAVFVRDLRRGTTRLVSDPAAAYPRAALARAASAAKATGPPAPAVIPADPPPALKPGQVAIVDNAFFAGIDRPTVRVGVGDELTWVWQSRQSHAVTVRSGPQRFGTRARNRSRFTHRFERAGTYDLVCSLHAPGMRMTVVVE